jgi:hypothetical protein
LGKRSKINNYLFYTFLDAFCEANGYDREQGFDKVLLEKLAVLFYRIGAKKQFIEVVYDHSHPDAINYGFYLFGVILTSHDKNNTDEIDFFPHKRDDWFLSSSCDGLLMSKKIRDGRSEKFFFNRIPSGDAIPKGKNGELLSRTLGHLLGCVMKSKMDNNDNLIEYPLDTERLTLLTSCYSGSDLTMAITAELDLISSWLGTTVKKSLSKGEVIRSDLFHKFSSSTVYTAFNQAFFKLSHSISNKNNATQIIKDISDFLSAHNSILKLHWEDLSDKLSIEQEGVFSVAVDTSTALLTRICHVSRCVFEIGNLLHYLNYLREIDDDIAYPKIDIGSIFEFINIETGKKSKRKIVPKMIGDPTLIEKYEIPSRTKIARTFIGRTVCDEEVSYHTKGIDYQFKVIGIDNREITPQLENPTRIDPLGQVRIDP